MPEGCYRREIVSSPEVLSSVSTLGPSGVLLSSRQEEGFGKKIETTWEYSTVVRDYENKNISSFKKKRRCPISPDTRAEKKAFRPYASPIVYVLQQSTSHPDLDTGGLASGSNDTGTPRHMGSKDVGEMCVRAPLIFIPFIIFAPLFSLLSINSRNATKTRGHTSGSRPPSPATVPGFIFISRWAKLSTFFSPS